MEKDFSLLLGFMPYQLSECSHFVEMILNEKKNGVAWLFCILKKIHILEGKIETNTKYQLKSSSSDETTCPQFMRFFEADLLQYMKDEWSLSGFRQENKNFKTWTSWVSADRWWVSSKSLTTSPAQSYFGCTDAFELIWMTKYYQTSKKIGTSRWPNHAVI